MSPSPPQDEYRLPTNVKPTHYDVAIKTDLQKLTFEGFVKINLLVQQDTSKIVLNTSELELGKALLSSNSLPTEEVVSTSSFDQKAERVTYELHNALPAGSTASLKIWYTGKLGDNMMGYYQSSWNDNGQTRYYALTQFEPTAARRAFPCWDEPLLKATFSVTLISRADTVNLSNMPAISERVVAQNASHEDPDISKLLGTTSPNDEWKVTSFERTPPMSTYIVAIANGHFEHLESSVKMPLSGKTIPLRIYATKDLIHQAQFSLDVKKAVLPLYEKVFDVEYPLPKLDTLVANDFDAGAMENWGLITGRTNAFLIDLAKADTQAKKQIMFTMSHEVAHMWFGDITTMEWWNYLYLNEGFATLMGEVIIAVFPEWKVDSEFVAEHLRSALELDAKLSSHPIEVDCPDANHINQIFDRLSYSKAASVLRMLANYVGEEHFLKGVSIYLKKKLYANSVTKDLWDGVSEATGIDVTKVMTNWVEKIGFPVLTVSETKDSITVRQDRFLTTGTVKPEENETIWTVPLSLLSTDKDGKVAVNTSITLAEREKTYPVDTSKTFKLNAGTTGPYRVLYSSERLSKIAEEAAREKSAFSTNDRVGLVQDATALARSGLAPLSDVFTLINALRHGTEYYVWRTVTGSLGEFDEIWWENAKIKESLDEFRRSLFRPLVDKLGFDFSSKDSFDTTLLRRIIITNAAGAGDEKVIQELKRRFAKLAETGDSSEIPADLERVTYKTAVRYGGVREYEAAIQLIEKPSSPASKISAIYAICATEDSTLLQRTFDYIKNKSRNQDVAYFFWGLSVNDSGKRTFAQFYKDEYNTFEKRFKGSYTQQSLISPALGSLATEKDYQEIVDFFKDKDTSKYDQTLAQMLDSIRAKIAVIDRSTDDLENWLKKWKSGSKL